LEKKTHKAILNHYTKLYKKFGDNPGSLGWPSGKQKIRFQALSEIANLNGSSILDVGCGFGDYLNFLQKKKLKINYYGVDINPTFINLAKQKFPNDIFKTLDLQQTKIKKHFDWSFAIGITNKCGSYKYIEDILNEMFKISKKGVAMDFLSSYVDFKGKGDFHSSPEKIFKIAKKLSKRVIIRHDYLPYQFCAYIFKDDKVMKNGVYSDWSEFV
jgi:ubiquinone/menaquinone biosynthesis C-methylase UbiE